MDVWMALDPETLRVLLQDRDFMESDFPPGLRGLGWPRRQGKMATETWSNLLTGKLSPSEQDELHRELWTESGAEPWPKA